MLGTSHVSICIDLGVKHLCFCRIDLKSGIFVISYSLDRNWKLFYSLIQSGSYSCLHNSSCSGHAYHRPIARPFERGEGGTLPAYGPVSVVILTL